MEVKVCKNCRRLFHYIHGPELCPNCSKLVINEKSEYINKTESEKNERASKLRPLVREEEEKLEKVKDFVMTHPRATLIQIADMFDILPSKLLDWVREDRLAFSDDSVYAWFTCEKCGKKIKSGRFCDFCKP